MLFGLSPSDIGNAIKLGLWIYEKAFSQAQGAHIQYFNFGQDIHALVKTLERLKAIIDSADDLRRQRLWQRPNDDYRAALQPVGDAAGDFSKTLEECKTLLDNKSRFRADTANFVRNVQWSLVVERDVNTLRDRVRFHLIKLGILLKPFELQLLLDIRREVRNLRQDVAEIRGLLTAQNGLLPAAGHHHGWPINPTITASLRIPEEVSRRFTEALSREPPTSFTDISNMPLPAATDALVYQFSRSTVEYNPGLDIHQRIPEVPQYVNLLKSRWILEKVEQSTELALHDPQSFWPRYLAEIKGEITIQYQRFHSQRLEAPSENLILFLDESCYSIWPPKAPTINPAPPTEPGPTEVKILELDLPDTSANRQSSLTVHRRTFTEFRLVTTTVDKHNQDFRHEKEVVVNTNTSAISPAYAVPSDQYPSPNRILIANHHANDLRWQTLSTLDDVKIFQQALLGYRVFHDMSDIQWSIDGLDKPGQLGHARLQLWEHKFLDDISEHNTHVGLYRVSSLGSVPPLPSPPLDTEPAPGTRRMTALSGSTMLSARRSMMSRVTGSRGGATVLIPPTPPVLVFFTTHDERHAFLQLELTCDVAVDNTQCGCRRGKGLCATTIITNKNKSLCLRRFCARQKEDQGLATWDLARFRYPQHPKFKDLEVLPKVKYLRLDFPSAALNGEFQAEWSALQKMRTLDLKAYNERLIERRTGNRKSS